MLKPYVIAALVAVAICTAPRPNLQTRADQPVAEIERDTAFAALQRLAINQQRIIDSTEAKLGVLALAVLAIFIGLLVEANMERAPWHSLWTVMLGVDMLPILAGMLGFKAEEPFDVPGFVAGFRFQAFQTINAAINEMAECYDANNRRRKIKEGLLAVSTLLAILFVSGETARRLNTVGALVGWFSTAVKALNQ
jgi:hypothetical protein